MNAIRTLGYVLLALGLAAISFAIADPECPEDAAITRCACPRCEARARKDRERGKHAAE